MAFVIENVLWKGECRTLAVKNGTFVEPCSVHDCETLDAQGCLGLPGFVNSHLHLDKSLLMERCEYIDVPGPEKGRLTREQKTGMTKKDIKTRASRVMDEAVSTGNLVLRTNVDIDPLVGLNGVEALLELKGEYADRVSLQVVPFAQEGFEKFSGVYDLLLEAMKLNVDGIGGHTSIDSDGRTHINNILDLAERFGCGADFHVDEKAQPDDFLLPYLADAVKQRGMQGKINAIHCSSLAVVDEARADRCLEQVAEAQIRVIVCPTAMATRPVAPVKQLRKHGIHILIGSDNIGDFFNPLGSTSMPQMALLLAYNQRLFTAEELDFLWTTVTSGGISLIGTGDLLGSQANLTLVAACSVRDALRNNAPVVLNMRGGVIV